MILWSGCCRECLPCVECLIQKASQSCCALAMTTQSASMICHREFSVTIWSLFYFPFLIQIGTLQPISCMHSCFPNCFLLCYYGLGLLRGVKFLPNKRFEPFSWALAVCFSLVMGLVKWECGNGVTGRLQLDDQCNIISAIMSFDSSLFHFLLFCFIFGGRSDISLPEKLLVENADFGLLAVGAQTHCHFLCAIVSYIKRTLSVKEIVSL